MSTPLTRPWVLHLAARSLNKVLVNLKEYTGPADPTDATAPSTFKVARETLADCSVCCLTLETSMFSTSPSAR